jgi:uncharacterized membrane protein
MAPFILLLASTIVFRVLGAFGLEVFGTWQDAARYAVALMFVFTGALHFTKMREDFSRMVPRILPYRLGLVYFTGLCQIMGAAGLLVSSITSIAGFCLVLLLVAMLPANVYAAQNRISFRGKPPTPLWPRVYIQLAFIGVTWWASMA